MINHEVNHETNHPVVKALLPTPEEKSCSCVTYSYSYTMHACFLYLSFACYSFMKHLTNVWTRDFNWCFCGAYRHGNSIIVLCTHARFDYHVI